MIGVIPDISDWPFPLCLMTARTALLIACRDQCIIMAPRNCQLGGLIDGEWQCSNRRPENYQSKCNRACIYVGGVLLSCCKSIDIAGQSPTLTGDFGAAGAFVGDTWNIDWRNAFWVFGAGAEHYGRTDNKCLCGISELTKHLPPGAQITIH